MKEDFLDQGVGMTTAREAILYCFLFTSVTLVNKYVLSELGFRYPTIFQGWQTFVGAVTLRLLHRFGKIDLDLSACNKNALARWLPYFLVFVVSIYSSSVALSSMAVPVFLCLHNVSSVLNLIADRIVMQGKVLSAREYLSCSIILVSVLFLNQTDPRVYQSSSAVYGWMLLHVVCSVFLVNYPKLFKHIPNIGEIGLLYVSYLSSVFTLLPGTILLGDAFASFEFPFWRHRTFYAGCVLSGLLGVAMNVHAHSSGLRHIQHIFALPVSVTGLAKCVASCVSVLVFPPVYSASLQHYAWCLANLLCGVLLSDARPQHDVIKPSLSDPDFTAVNLKAQHGEIL